MSILVVEATAPPILADLLRARGWPVLSASDGSAAMAVLEARTDVALLITEVALPVMDGLALIAAVRAHPELRAVPIVACTLAPGAEVHAALARLDVHHVLPRPVAPRTLLGIVEMLLAEDTPALEPACEVQSRLAIDERGYRRLAASVAALIARTTETLRPGTPPAPDQETLAVLAEAALLIGARRITTALGRVRAVDGASQAEALRSLQRELRRVYAALCAGPGGVRSATG